MMQFRKSEANGNFTIKILDALYSFDHVLLKSTSGQATSIPGFQLERTLHCGMFVYCFTASWLFLHNGTL